MKENEILIKIIGSTCSGKSLLADIILKSLAEYTTKSLTIDKIDEDIISLGQLKRMEHANEILENKAIHIQEVQLFHKDFIKERFND